MREVAENLPGCHGFGRTMETSKAAGDRAQPLSRAAITKRV